MRFLRLLSAWLLYVLIGLFATANSAAATTIHLDELKNKSALTTANDLHITFKGGAPTGVTVSDTDGKNFKKGTQSGSTVNFNTGDLPADVGPGKSVRIKYTGPASSKVDKRDTQSWWTQDGAQIHDVLASLDSIIDFELQTAGLVASFFNPNPFSITFDNIALYADNIVLDFDDPTGSLVTGLLTTLKLVPNETATLLFGNVNSDLIQLVRASVSEDGSDDAFFTGAATVVPLPAALPLLAGGLGLLGMLGWRSRQIAASGGRHRRQH